MKITGRYWKNLFRADNGYTVGLMRLKDSGDTITFQGNFENLALDYDYEFTGEYVKHPKYGEQFEVKAYSFLKPKEKDAVEAFLAEGPFKGIGKKKAKDIVKMFKDDTLDIIIKHPERLNEVKSLSKKNIEDLHNTLTEGEETYKIYIALNEMGFTSFEAKELFKVFKMRTLDVLKNNIYEAYLDVRDIGFKKVDQIYLKEGSVNDLKRLQAGLVYIVNEICMRTGSTYCMLSEALEMIGPALMCYEEIDINDIMTSYLVLEGDKLYPRSLYEAEKYIAAFLLNLMTPKINEDISKHIKQFEHNNKYQLSNSQKEAVVGAVKEPISIITGGPGTGKTTIIKTLTYIFLNCLSYYKDDLVLLAPTGRAAKRISEMTGKSASTIHRFLKWNKDDDSFLLNEFNKSDAKIVIIDEASMIDTLLLENLLRALKRNTKIIFVGDVNQLPAVSPGNILEDLIESKAFNVFKLTDIYRQAEDSSIISLAYSINQGKLNLSSGNGLYYLQSGDLETELAHILSNDRESDFIVLAPMYKGLYGIDKINLFLQNYLNPASKSKKERKYGSTIFREGDKVLQLNNMPEDNVYNGDIGFIDYIDGSDIYVNFDDNIVKYTPAKQNNLTLAYSISIHKAQGSEFNRVILPVYKQYNNMLYRKLYYTAVTRSKEKLYIIGDVDALEKASQNINRIKRRTSLKKRLTK